MGLLNIDHSQVGGRSKERRMTRRRFWMKQIDIIELFGLLKYIIELFGISYSLMFNFLVFDIQYHWTWFWFVKIYSLVSLNLNLNLFLVCQHYFNDESEMIPIQFVSRIYHKQLKIIELEPELMFGLSTYILWYHWTSVSSIWVNITELV